MHADIKDLKEVRNLLTSKGFTTSNWNELGLQLGLYHNTLEAIREKEREDSNKCLTKCLSAWLRKEDGVEKEGGPSWRTLAKAMDEIGEKAIAIYIRIELLPLKNSI